MDTGTATQNSVHINALTAPQTHQIDLPAIISDLKNEIATIHSEMQALLQQYLALQLTTTNPPTSVTWHQSWTSVGLLSYFRLQVITLKIWVCFFGSGKSGHIMDSLMIFDFPSIMIGTECKTTHFLLDDIDRIVKVLFDIFVHKQDGLCTHSSEIELCI